VGTSGDYAPFSTVDPSGERDGFDVAVARAYAQSRGLEIEWVPFRWPDLPADFAADRFDVVMSGVTVRPERSAAGRFSVPVAESGAVVLVPESSGLDLAALDSPAIRLAVNAGGHLERAARERFPRGRILGVPDNSRVMEALRAGRCQGVVTDTREAAHWRQEWETSGGAILKVLGPFTRDRKAYWWRPDDAARARDLDRWLLDQEQSGALATLRARHFGEASTRRTALPWPALVAALDERLSLMPAVAAVKRRDGLPIEVPEVEARVIAAGRQSVRREAAAAGRLPPLDRRTDAVFGALIESAKAIQRATPDDRPVTLELAILRPALLRIGDKLAFLLVRLPGPDTPRTADEMALSVMDETKLSGADAATARALAQALEAVAVGR
jgi:cyclohexadienyl dehydratase